MSNRYYVIIILTNAEGQDASSVSAYDSLEKAQVAYHNLLSAYHNAPDVLYAIVQIIEGEYGNLQTREIVDHRSELDEE